MTVYQTSTDYEKLIQLIDAGYEIIGLHGERFEMFEFRGRPAYSMTWRGGGTVYRYDHVGFIRSCQDYGVRYIVPTDQDSRILALETALRKAQQCLSEMKEHVRYLGMSQDGTICRIGMCGCREQIIQEILDEITEVLK